MPFLQGEACVSYSIIALSFAARVEFLLVASYRTGSFLQGLCSMYGMERWRWTNVDCIIYWAMLHCSHGLLVGRGCSGP